MYFVVHFTYYKVITTTINITTTIVIIIIITFVNGRTFDEPPRTYFTIPLSYFWMRNTLTPFIQFVIISNSRTNHNYYHHHRRRRRQHQDEMFLKTVGSRTIWYNYKILDKRLSKFYINFIVWKCRPIYRDWERLEKTRNSQTLLKLVQDRHNIIFGSLTFVIFLQRHVPLRKIIIILLIIITTIMK